VGAYGMSKYLNWDDHKIASLFADGAGAVVLKGTREPKAPGILASKLFTLGEFHDYMGIYAGGTNQPITEEVVRAKGHLLNFAKRIPADTNSTHWPRLIHSLLDRSQRSLSDVSLFFLTQINIGTIEETMCTLGLPENLSYNIMDRFAYTGSASIGMAVADAANHHRLRKGDLVILVGSGGGVSMAAVALEWAYDT
ncbi:MAG: ketoacyl-ACP synthase III, partial [Proteobacteria bacterium]